MKKLTPTHTKSGEPLIRYRQGNGQFKEPPPAPSQPAVVDRPLAPAELDQDSGQGYNPNHDNIQE
jgi:hypothetical protein